MRRITALSAVLLAVAVPAAGARAASDGSARSASLLIRHQVRGCHAWSVNGGPFRAAQSLSLPRGGKLVVMNNDVMPHRLLEVGGAPVAMRNGTTMPMGAGMHGAAAPGVMNHMGATTTVTLVKPGIYRFRTRPGEDYMAGIKTVGEDNVLMLTVTVR